MQRLDTRAIAGMRETHAGTHITGKLNMGVE